MTGSAVTEHRGRQSETHLKTIAAAGWASEWQEGSTSERWRIPIWIASRVHKIRDGLTLWGGLSVKNYSAFNIAHCMSAGSIGTVGKRRDPEQ